MDGFRLFKKAAIPLGLVAAALAGVWRPVASQAGARPNAPVWPIQHIVVLYQENHSFDNVLGAWCNTFTPSRCDGFTGTVTLKDQAQVTMQQSPDIVPNVAHNVPAQTLAMDGGKMDGWDQIIGCKQAVAYRCLTYYTPQQIPNLAQLAAQFAVSDRTFSMADSPSWGGHLYAIASTLDGFLGNNPQPTPGVASYKGWGCDSNKFTQWTNPSSSQVTEEPACVPDPSLSAPNGGACCPTPVAYVPTLLDRLDAAGDPWRIYGATRSQGSGYQWDPCSYFAECLYGAQIHNVVPTQNVLADAANGTLPAFSLLLPWAGPSGSTAQHNTTSMLAGDNWIGQVVSAIENGPDWSSTAIFITYDDCGCFYDHVAPPINPDGSQQGPRVPMVIVSPYARPAYTDSTPASFASILAYVEADFGLSPLTAIDASAYDFSSAFNYSQVPIHGVPLHQHALPPGESIPPTDMNDPT